MTKKVYKQKSFPVITKNSNWEISTMNLVPFKRWDGAKDTGEAAALRKTKYKQGIA